MQPHFMVRAAQGVVLVTTKRSSTSEKTKSFYSGNFRNLEKVNQFLDYQNGWEREKTTYLLDHNLTKAST